MSLSFIAHKKIKMIGIGLRVMSNKKIFYTIIEETPTEYSYLSVSSLIVPKALNQPERLNYIRNTLIDIIDQYKVTNAIIREAESIFSTTQVLIQRIHIEGVILETIASGNIEKYAAGKIASLTRILELAKGEFKDYADNKKSFLDLPDIIEWPNLVLEERESILACHASLKL